MQWAAVPRHSKVINYTPWKQQTFPHCMLCQDENQHSDECEKLISPVSCVEALKSQLSILACLHDSSWSEGLGPLILQKMVLHWTGHCKLVCIRHSPACPGHLAEIHFNSWFHLIGPKIMKHVLDAFYIYRVKELSFTKEIIITNSSTIAMTCSFL